MHIPDGFLDTHVSQGLGFAAAAIVSFAWKMVHDLITEPSLQRAFATISKKARGLKEKAGCCLSAFGNEYLAKMGMVASLVFSLQMFNFPVVSGTSGHFMGGVFAAVLLGPWGGTLCLTAVLLVQAVLYADGGILVLGANIINMAVIGSVLGHYLYRGLVQLTVPRYAAAAVTAWASVVLASIACSVELGLSGTYALGPTVQAMVPVHMLIGVGEAIATIVFLIVAKKVMGWQEYGQETEE